MRHQNPLYIIVVLFLCTCRAARSDDPAQDKWPAKWHTVMTEHYEVPPICNVDNINYNNQDLAFVADVSVFTKKLKFQKSKYLLRSSMQIITYNINQANENIRSELLGFFEAILETKIDYHPAETKVIDALTFVSVIYSPLISPLYCTHVLLFTEYFFVIERKYNACTTIHRKTNSNALYGV